MTSSREYGFKENKNILKQLKNKVGALEAQIAADTEKGAPRDPIRETAVADIESLRDSLTQGTEKFFQFALYITFYADDMAELDRTSDTIEDILGSRLVYTLSLHDALLISLDRKSVV